MGQSYLLGCPEDGETQLREAVARVDSAMCGIRDAGKVKARDRIAVLASLNLAFDLVQREHDLAAAQADAQAQLQAQLQARLQEQSQAHAQALAEVRAKAEAAAAAAATAAAPAPKPGPLVAYKSVVAAPIDPRIAQLTQRLDQALASDGLLL